MNGFLLQNLVRGLCLIFAGILVLALLILVFAVLSPIRYEAKVTFQQDGSAREGDSFQVSFHFRWLFSLVRGGISWPREDFLIYILFFRFNLSAFLSESSSREKDLKAKQQKKSKKNRLRDSMKKEARRVSILLRLLLKKSKEGERPVQILLHNVYGVLRTILPVKWWIRGTIGLNDPAKTGKFMEAESLLLPLLADHLWIRPDFEKEQTALQAYGKGSVCPAAVLAAVGRLFCSWRKIDPKHQLIPDVRGAQ